MTNEQAYEIWAPSGATWSPWVAPVLFTQLECASREASPLQELLPPWTSSLASGTAVILDIDGVDAVRIAVALAYGGLAPVPLFNASPGPMITLGLAESTVSCEAVPMRHLVSAMCWATNQLAGRSFPAISTDPVFLLDSRRLPPAPTPGMFDNRWILVPQDFPSATFLKQQGITRVMVVQPDWSAPQSDLAHVLLRYQEQGIELQCAKVEESDIRPLSVRRPPMFRSAFYRFLARLGLRRHALGGFGSWVPESHGGG